MLLRDIRSRRNDIAAVAQRHGVGRIRLFGSSARDEAAPESDVDFLIDVDGPTTPWFPGGLVADLEALLGCRVDVVETQAIRRELRESILKEAVPL